MKQDNRELSIHNQYILFWQILETSFVFIISDAIKIFGKLANQHTLVYFLNHCIKCIYKNFRYHLHRLKVDNHHFLNPIHLILEYTQPKCISLILA